MDRFLYDEVRAAAKHPELEVRIWGHDWPFYNNSEIPIVNINNVFGSPDYFDIVYTIEAWFNRTFPSSVVIHSVGDCHGLDCVKDNNVAYNADGIALRYAGILLDLFRWEQWQKRVKDTTYENRSMPFLFHHTDCGDETILHPAELSRNGERWEDSRPYKARLFGAVNAGLYPLRTTVKKGIEEGIIKAELVIHPGYNVNAEAVSDLPTNDTSSAGLVLDRDPHVAHLFRIQQSYAEQLRQTQICIFDSSVVRKAIRKYHEAFLSGCVVAGDIPLEMENTFRDVVIPLRLDMSASEIQATLDEYVHDTERLAWMAVEGFRRARAVWTCRAKVDRLLEAAGKIKGGEKGYWFPFEFSATCREYPWSRNEEDKSPWCSWDQFEYSVHG
ncbi:hypothetical protein HDU76_001965 [Blyttiomyces sp. JEL0837]|nr:hypothetical protein HDU76_001965 [Blyttiomyces sp. JEL0837]